MNQEKIGRFISTCRKESGLTQAELAEKLCITDRAISKWETGKGMPDASIMLELCEQLGITVNELLSGERLDMDDYKSKAEENLLDLLERSLYKSSEAASSITFGEFQNALIRITEVTELLQTFETKEKAVDYLMKETRCSLDECSQAYDIYTGMMKK